jgi:hypothetical protein
MIAQVHPPFPKAAFPRDALADHETLELMPRGRHIAAVLRRHLPQDVPAALDILLACLDVPCEGIRGSMASFLFMPHTVYVVTHALDHFEEAMCALHALTQRFTAEFSISPFIERDQARTLARLHEWTQDSSEHVRRLASEGTRPRLPRPQRVLVDLRLHYIKSNYESAPKVFKLKTVELAPRALAFGKTLSLADLGTRRHHPDVHRIEALLNGRAVALGESRLTGRRSG